MNSTRLSLAIICLCFVWGYSARDIAAQDKGAQTFGDSALKKEIAPLSRTIYDQGGERIFMFVRENVLSIQGTQSTELQATMHEGHITRIIVTAYMTDGKYNIEYYIHQDELIHVFETFEYVEEASPKDAWRNFKGYAAWERRSYFKDGTIGYAEAQGDSTPGKGGDAMIGAAKRLEQVLLDQAH